MRLTVVVRLKPGIMDVQGSAVQRALAALGFTEVSGLRVGKVLDVDLEAASEEEARARVDDMCRRLLVNPLLESYTIERAEPADLAAPRTQG